MVLGVEIHILVQMAGIPLMGNDRVKVVACKLRVSVDVDRIVLIIIQRRHQVKCRAQGKLQCLGNHLEGVAACRKSRIILLGQGL